MGKGNSSNDGHGQGKGKGKGGGTLSYLAKLFGLKKEVKPPAINPHDSTAVRRTLDESVATIIPSLGFMENKKRENIRMLIMFLACVVGCIGQFYPGFPENKGVIWACVVTYFSLSFFLYLWNMFVEQNIILTCTGKVKEDADKSKVKGGEFITRNAWPAFHIRTSMKLPDPTYTIVIERADDKTELGQLSKSYGSYFTKEGYFAESLLKQDIIEVLRSASGKLKTRSD